MIDKYTSTFSAQFKYFINLPLGENENTLRSMSTNFGDFILLVISLSI